MPTDTFLERLGQRRKLLADEQTRIKADQAELDLRSARVTDELRRLRETEETYRNLMPQEPQESANGTASGGTGRTLVENIAAWLREHGGFGRIGSIWRDLLANRQLNAANSRSAYNQVYGALTSHSEVFQKLGDGWILVGSTPTDESLQGLVADGSAEFNGTHNPPDEPVLEANQPWRSDVMERLDQGAYPAVDPSMHH